MNGIGQDVGQGTNFIKCWITQFTFLSNEVQFPGVRKLFLYTANFGEHNKTQYMLWLFCVEL